MDSRKRESSIACKAQRLSRRVSSSVFRPLFNHFSLDRVKLTPTVHSIFLRSICLAGFASKLKLACRRENPAHREEFQAL